MKTQQRRTDESVCSCDWWNQGYVCVCLLFWLFNFVYVCFLLVNPLIFPTTFSFWSPALQRLFSVIISPLFSSCSPALCHVSGSSPCLLPRVSFTFVCLINPSVFVQALCACLHPLGSFSSNHDVKEPFYFTFVVSLPWVWAGCESNFKHIEFKQVCT